MSKILYKPEEHSPSEMRYFATNSFEQRTNIYDAFNTNEEQIRKDVVYLMEWLEQQPHLPKIKGKTRNQSEFNHT